MAVRMKLVSSGDMKTLTGTNCSYKLEFHIQAVLIISLNMKIYMKWI